MNKKELTAIIKQEALKNGFDLFGATPALNKKSNKLDEWLIEGYHASMKWMETRKDERNDIYKYFPEVKTVISLGYNYYTDENDLETNNLKMSNYAWGEDYHLIIKKKLYTIIESIKEYKKDFKFRVCVDTSPILEKPWAQKAGLGWIGKHTNLINENLGSWFFLAEILLDFELEYNNPHLNDLCGTCTKCIDECPTDAIFEEYRLDSNKCISYLTIEHRGELPNKYKDELNGWIYGCDICQQVCPWNIKFSQKSNDSNFKIKDKIKNMNNGDWNKLTKEDFNLIFKKSAVKRTKFEGLKRNIKANKNL